MKAPSECVNPPPVVKVANRGDTDRMSRARERDLMALQLRLRGDSWQRIADQMGFKCASQAYAVWKRAMDRTCREVADETRQLEVERLDALWRVMFAKAMTGSHQAVDRCLAIMDRRAKLLGLDAPARARIDVVDIGQLVDAVESLERENEAMEARIAARDDDVDVDREFALPWAEVDQAPDLSEPQLISATS